ncbi:MAG: ABC transporter ATP-binding protein [Planctomycetes bacterium]|nr:ABC transporter ATP-binding protein [Planctomycetota bacterium]
MAAAISVQQLAVSFRSRGGTVAALQPLDLEVAPGCILGVLGPNGSGKTTLLRVLAGLQAPTQGRAELLGLPPTHPRQRQQVGYQPEGSLPFGVLSAPEFLAYAGATLGLPNDTADARAALWLDRLELRHAGRRPVRTFSTGMRKRLALAAALLAEPRVLLLDEPTAGLDPLGSAVVMDVLRERRTAGTTVLLASHHLLEIEELCDEVVVLQDGALRLRGTLAELLGTDADALVVRGLSAEGLQRLSATAEELGGTVLRVARERQHLFALFRRLAAPQLATPPLATGAAAAQKFPGQRTDQQP